jgi:LPS-assembly lipoprotein
MTPGSLSQPNRNPATALRIGLLVLLMAVAGCGWQLRGHGDAPQYVDSLYIGGRPIDNELKTELERSLRAFGIELKDNAKDAQYSLVMLDQRSKRRTATLSGQARISEQELSEELKFTVRAADGAEIIPPTTISDERVYEYDENNVLATDDEARLLRKEMRTSLVRQLINYLQRIGPRTPDKDAPAP